MKAEVQEAEGRCGDSMGELNDADANAITWEEACDLERKLCHRPKAKKYLGAGKEGRTLRFN